MTNELQTQNTTTQNAIIVQDANGKFKRVAEYKAFSSVKPETKEQKIAYFNLLKNDDSAFPMKDNKGAVIEIADVIFNPYESVNEDTGEIENGVVSYVIDQEGRAFVTSSKSVYFTLVNIMKAFGRPHYNAEEAVKVEIVEKKGTQFKYIDLTLIG